MDRPRCRLCHGPLDLAWDRDTLRWEWSCGSPQGEPPACDEDFADVWQNLPIEEAKRLEAEVKPKGER